MDKIKILETVAIILVLIGFVSFLSQKFFFIETLRNAYGLGDFFQVVGLILIYVAFRQKRKSELK